jgi:23S rRNA pseudouridine2605 synthase
MREKSATGSQAEATQKLHKVLAQAGLGSRRTMEDWIRSGRVTVNGVVAGIGTRVTPHDLIRVGRRLVRWPAQSQLPRVMLYHKPEGEIASRDDPEGRPTVFAKLPRLRGAKWVAVGRLDYNTCGLLVFTTSGELANRMMHPRFEVEREYAVRVLGQLKAEQISKLKSGVTLDDGPAHCIAVQDEGGEGANHWYRIVLAEGRNRVVRRMFSALGMTVSRLMRVRFGVLSLPPRLKRGQLSELPPDEVRQLLRWLKLPCG